MQTATATPQAPCYATHNHVPETATERLIKAALDLVERDLCFIGNTISIPTLSHSEGIRRNRGDAVMGRVYLPHSEPLACWKEDPLGAIALFVTMAVLIAATGVASFL